MLRGRRVLAFCGLGNPAGFRHTLEVCGYDVVEFHEFPDHHAYGPGDLKALAAAARQTEAEALVCTQKDLVKIGVDRLGDRPLWAVRVGIDFLAGREAFKRGCCFCDKFLKKKKKKIYRNYAVIISQYTQEKAMSSMIVKVRAVEAVLPIPTPTGWRSPWWAVGSPCAARGNFRRGKRWSSSPRTRSCPPRWPRMRQRAGWGCQVLFPVPEKRAGRASAGIPRQSGQAPRTTQLRSGDDYRPHPGRPGLARRYGRGRVLRHPEVGVR